METQPKQVTPILEVAWTRFAQLDAISKKRTKAHMRMRRWIGILGILATLFAILTEIYPENFPVLGGFILKLLLVLSPILASALAAFVSKFFSDGDWLITRAGAEEILKEIFAFRTILQSTPTRRSWLEKRLGEIQRSVFRGMNGELVMQPYEGQLPPNYSPDDPSSDPGFHDLTGDEYFRYRLENQLEWHVRKINDRQRERIRLQVLIIASGVAGAVLAALGGSLSLWVALTASFTSVFIGWQELRNLDTVVRNYSKVIMELNLLYDHWKNLTTEEQTQTEFFNIVRSTEDILWSQNVEYIKAMQEALKESDLEQEAGLVNRVIKEQRESDQRFKNEIANAVVDHTRDSMVESEEKLVETYESTLGTLAAEASSELVQAELAAMRDAVHNVVENITERLGMSSSLNAIKEEFDGVEIDGNTPKSVLNDFMSRYPKTTDVNG